MTPTAATRRLRFAALAALLCGALVVGADRLAAGLAEHAIADRIAGARPGLAARPDVTVEGFPFLPQAATGTFDQVRVEARRAGGAAGPAVSADVRLRQVRRHGGGYTAAQPDARFRVTLADLAEQLAPGSELTELGPDRLRLSRDLLGRPLTVDLTLTLQGRTVVAHPTTAAYDGRPVDPRQRPQLSQFLGRDLTRTLPDLPIGLTATALRTDAGALTLDARTDHPTLG
ncbi:hypothetical protein GCM10009665_71990 [Kitasatospora nipponensis]|uniref:DUF2993 family protein n=1 Tax=Kitasatospora nipponensis TaxID=258049 RepID=A0ABN1WZJ4_9ACTN